MVEPSAEGVKRSWKRQQREANGCGKIIIGRQRRTYRINESGGKRDNANAGLINNDNEIVRNRR